MKTHYLNTFFLIFPRLNAAYSDSQIEETVARDFQKFLLSNNNFYKIKTEAAFRTETENGDNISNWERLQKKRKENVVKIVNSTFQPLQDYFNYERLTGYHAGDETYHVGSIARHLSQLVQTLPDIGIVPKLTWLWHFIIKGEELELKARLEDKIGEGEVLYTNRKRDGGFLYQLVERSPWWHSLLTFCQTASQQFGPKSLACSIIADFGLTLLIKIVFLRDLVVCAGLTALTGDTNLCLALYISKLAFPGWLGDYDTPWIDHNVHLKL